MQQMETWQFRPQRVFTKKLIAKFYLNESWNQGRQKLEKNVVPILAYLKHLPTTESRYSTDWKHSDCFYPKEALFHIHPPSQITVD